MMIDNASLSLNAVQYIDSGGNSGLFIGVISVLSRSCVMRLDRI